MFNSWYQNVGKLMQRIARIGFAIEAICIIIGGVILTFVALAEGAVAAVFLMPIAVFFAIIAAFLASLPMYGFGLLVESAEVNIENNARHQKSKKDKQQPFTPHDYSNKNQASSSPKEEAHENPMPNNIEVDFFCNNCGLDFYINIPQEGIQEIVCPDCNNRITRRISMCPNCKKVNVSSRSTSTVKCDDCHTKYNLN